MTPKTTNKIDPQATFILGDVADLAELPTGRSKSKILANIEDVIKAKDVLKRGLPAGKFIQITLTEELITQLKVKTGSRLVKKELQGFIENGKLKSQDGKRLVVQRFKHGENEAVRITAEGAGNIDWGYSRRRKRKGAE